MQMKKTFHILTSQVSCVPKISSSFIIIITAELSMWILVKADTVYLPQGQIITLENIVEFFYNRNILKIFLNHC